MRKQLILLPEETRANEKNHILGDCEKQLGRPAPSSELPSATLSMAPAKGPRYKAWQAAAHHVKNPQPQIRTSLAE